MTCITCKTNTMIKPPASFFFLSYKTIFWNLFILFACMHYADYTKNSLCFVWKYKRNPGNFSAVWREFTEVRYDHVTLSKSNSDNDCEGVYLDTKPVWCVVDEWPGTSAHFVWRHKLVNDALMQITLKNSDFHISPTDKAIKIW